MTAEAATNLSILPTYKRRRRGMDPPMAKLSKIQPLPTLIVVMAITTSVVTALTLSAL